MTTIVSNYADLDFMEQLGNTYGENLTSTTDNITLLQKLMDERALFKTYYDRVMKLQALTELSKSEKVKTANTILLYFAFGYWGANKNETTGEEGIMMTIKIGDRSENINMSEQLQLKNGLSFAKVRESNILTASKCARLGVLAAYMNSSSKIAAESPVFRRATYWNAPEDKKFLSVHGYLLPLKASLDRDQTISCLAINFDVNFKSAPPEIRETLPIKMTKIMTLCNVTPKEVFDYIDENAGEAGGADVETVRSYFKTRYNITSEEDEEKETGKTKKKKKTKGKKPAMSKEAIKKKLSGKKAIAPTTITSSTSGSSSEEIEE